MWEEETTDNKFIGCFLNTDFESLLGCEAVVFEHRLHGLHGFFWKGHGLGLYWV